MEELYLPGVSHFENENIWIASKGRLSYKVTPVPAETRLDAEIWEGPWEYNFSVVEECAGFPLTDEGIEALRAWVLSRAEEINARPPRTLAENLARREAAIKQKEAAAQSEA